MIKQIKINLRATKVFFFVRFVASLLVGVVYIFLAANVQYLFVSVLGESTFNYIIGGLLSLVVGAGICGLLGRFLFILIRGWHMAAIAYSRQIVRKNLPALDAGMTVFKKHFSSFAAVYGASVLMRKVIDSAAGNVWELLEDVPCLGSLRKFSANPIVVKVAKDILDTAFDAAIYYLIRYTKPGVQDDMTEVIAAFRKYLFALPQVIVGSLTSFFLFYVLPKFLAILCVCYIFFTQGIVAGILISVLLYPLFFILRNSLFDPMETVILVSGFAKYCQDSTEDTEQEDESLYGEVVNAILEEVGLTDLLSDDEGKVEDTEEAEEVEEETEEGQTEEAPPPPRERVEPETPRESAPLPRRPRHPRFGDSESTPAAQVQATAPMPGDEQSLGDIISSTRSNPQVTGQGSLTGDDIRATSESADGAASLSMLATRFRECSAQEADGGAATREPPIAPVQILSGGLGGLSSSDLAGMINATPDGESESQEGSDSLFEDVLGGGSIDVI